MEIKTNDHLVAFSDAKETFRKSVRESVAELEKHATTENLLLHKKEMENRRSGATGIQTDIRTTPIHVPMNHRPELALLPISLIKFNTQVRQRLGLSRDPFIAGFFLPFLSLGLYIPFWLITVDKELNWHLCTNESSKKGNLTRYICAVAPGFQSLLFYQIAKKLNKCNLRNLNRNDVSAPFVAMLSLVPLLAIIYLQSRLNRYWQSAAIRSFG